MTFFNISTEEWLQVRVTSWLQVIIINVLQSQQLNPESFLLIINSAQFSCVSGRNKKAGINQMWIKVTMSMEVSFREISLTTHQLLIAKGFLSNNPSLGIRMKILIKMILLGNRWYLINNPRTFRMQNCNSRQDFRKANCSSRSIKNMRIIPLNIYLKPTPLITDAPFPSQVHPHHRDMRQQQLSRAGIWMEYNPVVEKWGIQFSINRPMTTAYCHLHPKVSSLITLSGKLKQPHKMTYPKIINPFNNRNKPKPLQ